MYERLELHYSYISALNKNYYVGMLFYFITIL